MVEGIQSNDRITPVERGFFADKVCIIESVTSNDIACGSILYNNLKSDINTRECELYTPSSGQDLFDSLNRILKDIKLTGKYPILHFCMHGDTIGLEINNGDEVEWLQLKKILIDINVACHNNLLITLAVCEGAYLLNIIHPKDRSPFWGMIGNVEGVHQGQSPIAFTKFYKELLLSKQLASAFDILNLYHKEGINIKLNTFSLVNSEMTFKKVYRKYKKNHLSSQALEHRAKKIMLKSKVGRHFSGMTRRQSIEKIQLDIFEKSQQEFIEMWEHFFMVDLYTENKDRFPMRYIL